MISTVAVLVVVEVVYIFVRYFGFSLHLFLLSDQATCQTKGGEKKRKSTQVAEPSFRRCSMLTSSTYLDKLIAYTCVFLLAEQSSVNTERLLAGGVFHHSVLAV